MLDVNSYAEFILGTFEAQLVDCALQYPDLAKEFKRDYQRLSSAINSHGIRFALDTMPAYRKHFDKCLDERRLTPSHLTNFGVDRIGGTIPRLFRGLVLRVFDRDGILRIDADKEAVRWLRQLLGVVRKLKLASSDQDTRKSVRDFYQLDFGVQLGDRDWSSDTEFEDDMDTSAVSFTDLVTTQNIPKPDTRESSGPSRPTLPYGLLEKVQQAADLITGSLGVFNPMEWRPRHGHGAVSDHGFGAYKYAFDSWPDRLETVFPYADFAIANYAQVFTGLDSRGSSLARFGREIPAKLCAVPKTLSKPRLIASEPTASQWCQQAVRDYFYKRTSDTFISSFVAFAQQEKNGVLALSASQESSHATIDLSSASDYISCWHVERLFRRSPSLLRALRASRSAVLEQRICRDLPRRVAVRKYSTMGNATTFPVQSLLFLSFALGALAYARGLRVDYGTVRSLGEYQVRVFGDDIIIPRDCSGSLLELLEALSMRVNLTKTFTVGNFRESCGVDAFCGHDVTTVSVLDVPRRASPGSIISSKDVHHNLCEKGMMFTANWIRKTAERDGLTQIRFVEHGSGLFGWSSLYGGDNPSLKRRFEPNLQRLEIRCLACTNKLDRTPAEGSAGLLQFFTEASTIVSSAISTLGHLTQRPKVGLTLRWVAA